MATGLKSLYRLAEYTATGYSVQLYRKCMGDDKPNLSDVLPHTAQLLHKEDVT